MSNLGSELHRLRGQIVHEELELLRELKQAEEERKNLERQIQEIKEQQDQQKKGR